MTATAGPAGGQTQTEASCNNSSVLDSGSATPTRAGMCVRGSGGRPTSTSACCWHQRPCHILCQSALQRTPQMALKLQPAPACRADDMAAAGEGARACANSGLLYNPAARSTHTLPHDKTAEHQRRVSPLVTRDSGWPLAGHSSMHRQSTVMIAVAPASASSTRYSRACRRPSDRAHPPHCNPVLQRCKLPVICYLKHSPGAN